MKVFLRVSLVLFSLFFAITSRGEVVDKIIAIVNDDIITLQELQGFVHIEKKNQFTSIDEYLRDIQLKEKLDFFISSLLIKQQAKKLRIDVSDNEVDSIIENIKKQNLITEIELKEQLKKDNITYENFAEGIRLNILRNRVLTRVISPEVRVTDAMLKDFYEKHKDEYRSTEYRVKQIFVSGQRSDGSERATNAYKQLDQGKKFEDVAVEFSDDPSGKQGGDIGFVKVEELLPSLRESLKLLVPNTYTNVVQTPYGFNILKLIEIKKTDLSPFEEMKDKIHEQIVLQESEKRYSEYINKLRQSSYIEVKI
jgi:peptidyl-prolyl cis-trans isomerase SurA